MTSWVTCARHDGYEVSDDGRVRNRKTGRILKATQNHSRLGRRPGYFKVCLGRALNAYVHQLVAEAFLGPRPDGHDIDHVDHDRANNAASNLRWLPVVENRIRWCGPGRNDFELTKLAEAPEDHEPMTEEERHAVNAELAAAGW